MSEQPSSQRNATQHKRKRWWATDCPVCMRMRLYVVWTVIMLVVYFYVFDK